MQLYIEDAINKRIWVDSDQCKCFVDNIIESAKTIPSPQLDLDSGTRVDLDEDFIDIEKKKDYLCFSRLVIR